MDIAKRFTDLTVPSALLASTESLTIVKVLPNRLEAVIIQIDDGGKLIWINDCARDSPDDHFRPPVASQLGRSKANPVLIRQSA